MVRSQRDLSRELSNIQLFENPQFKLEQYETPAHIATEWIWEMASKGEVAGKIILYAGCGTGILGLGLLLMGARKVYFVDKDESAMKICIDNHNKLKEAYEIGDAEFISHDITLFDEQVDIVVQNPPFGTKEVHADKKFLEVAFKSAPIIYSMHKYSTKSFVEAICKDFGFTITDTIRYDFPIKAKYEFHLKPVKNIDVGLWRMEKD